MSSLSLRLVRSLVPLVIIGAVFPLPAAGDTVIASDPTASDVSAHGGVLVWSRKTAGGPYRLVERRDGVVQDAPVRSFKHPVDADLGPGRRGGVRAVYTRCAIAGPTRRCDLFKLNLATGREQRLTALSSGRRAEFAPAAWQSRVAFSRAATVSYVSSFEGSFARFGRYPGAGLFKSLLRRRISRDVADQTDLAGLRVAYHVARPTEGGSGAAQIIRTQRFGRTHAGRRCTLMSDTSTDASSATYLLSPVLYGDYVYWFELVESHFGEGSSHLLRRRLPDRRCRSRGGIEDGGSLGGGHLYSPREDPPTALAVDGGRFYVSDHHGVREVTAPVFKP